MNKALLDLYHHLPGPMRTVAASLRGLYLHNWRFGPETDRLIEQAQEREQWSARQWKDWRDERLSYVLERAATRVPYYRDQWARRRRGGDRASWLYVENWPVLEKEEVRANASAFVADDCDTRRMFAVNTSGTTGKPLRLWRSRKTLRELYALSAGRTTGWQGLSRSDRWARLGGQLVTPVRRRRPPFWVWNAALNQLYMSAYHLAPDLASHYLDALADYEISYLFGYTSSIHALAQEAIRLGRKDLKMKVVITNAEPLLSYQRGVIAEAFGCAVRETYGMGEMVAAASECGEGTLHQWPEVGMVELLGGSEAGGGEAGESGSMGEFVCTGLLNEDMPLIRYRVGDCGSLAHEQSGCRCGRPLPAIAGLDGRKDDLLITRDGRRLFFLNPVFYEVPVLEAQIVQESLDQVRVRYVPAQGFTAVSSRIITERLQARMGRIDVVLEEVDKVPRSSNSKFRAVICNVPAAEQPCAPDEKLVLS